MKLTDKEISALFAQSDTFVKDLSVELENYR